MKSVFIAVPCSDLVHAQFMSSLFRALNALSANRITYAFSIIQGSSITKNRNEAVRLFLESGLDYLMFLDSDMKFPESTILDLLKCEKDIVGATYRFHWRKSPEDSEYRLNHVELDGSEGNLRPKLKEPEVADYTKNTAIFDDRLSHLEIERTKEILRIGTGALLISKSVLKSMNKPWFQFFYEEGSAAEHGEDYYFCKKARNAGFKVWLDADLSKQIEHIGTYGYRI